MFATNPGVLMFATNPSAVTFSPIHFECLMFATNPLYLMLYDDERMLYTNTAMIGEPEHQANKD